MTTLALILAAGGAAFILLATVGLLRFPDGYTRSHAAGKAATLGICGVLLGAAIGLGSTGALARAGLAMAFLFFGIPVAAQLVARAAFRSGVLPAAETRLDPRLCDLDDVVEEDDEVNVEHDSASPGPESSDRAGTDR